MINLLKMINNNAVLESILQKRVINKERRERKEILCIV